MAIALVYYSLEGNSKYVANKILEYIKADVIQLKPVKDYPTGHINKYIWGGKSVVFGETPKLKKYSFSASKYDTIIIGTPIWAGSYSPPIKTFLKDNDLSKKNIAIYACHMGGGAEKCFNKLKNKIVDSNVIATLQLVSPYTNQSKENISKIKEFCKAINSI